MFYVFHFISVKCGELFCDKLNDYARLVFTEGKAKVNHNFIQHKTDCR